jgi:hypothetical protein
MTGWDDHLAKVRAAARLTEVAEDLKRRKFGARAFIRTDHVVRVQAWNQSTPAIKSRGLRRTRRGR